ncbi:MAG TPA: hypothetical protein PK199_09150 [Bacteroidales bacterium]|nr:hypothetical protein [Bacteroidales bacterium]
MQKVFYVLIRYKKIAIFCSITCIVFASTLLFLHEVQRADIQLLEHVQELVDRQKFIIHIPQGWEIEGESNCLQQSHYSISYINNQGVFRKIIYPYIHHDTKFCISKQIAVQWTLYHTITIATIGIVSIIFWILLYYVLTMFVYARIWKYIVHIQRMCKGDFFDSSDTQIIKKLTYILNMYQSQNAIQKALQTEFASSFKQIHSDLHFYFEQKKIPDTWYREFKNLYELLDTTAQ